MQEMQYLQPKIYKRKAKGIYNRKAKGIPSTKMQEKIAVKAIKLKWFVLYFEKN